MLTGDRDMFQCATDHVTVLLRGRGAGPQRIDPAEVGRRYGVGPELVPDFIALRGDPSDGLPGAKGIGEKRAADILRRHGSLEAALEEAERPRGQLPRAPGRRVARLSRDRHAAAGRSAATAVTGRPTRRRARRRPRELGMNRLAKRLEKQAA